MNDSPSTEIFPPVVLPRSDAAHRPPAQARPGRRLARVVRLALAPLSWVFAVCVCVFLPLMSVRFYGNKSSASEGGSTGDFRTTSKPGSSH